MRVKQHIGSFSVVKSHFTRKSKMFDLFMEECKENQLPRESLITEGYFAPNTICHFFKPKKGRCESCNEYQKTVDKEELS